MKWLIGSVLTLMLIIPLGWSWDRDLIPVNEGFGWDGNLYGMYTQFLPEAIEQGAINTYRMQRMLVPAAIYAILDATGSPREKVDVIRAFRVTNILCIVISLVILLLIASASAWFLDTRWLGMAAVFFSIPMMKMSLFYPILSDIPAFLFGLLAILCWRKGWNVGLLLVILIGAFTGPTMWVYGLLFLTPQDTAGNNTVWKPASPFWAALLPMVFLVVWTWAWKHHPEVFSDPPSASQSVRFTLLPFSLAIVLVYLFWVGQLLRGLMNLDVKTVQNRWLLLIPFAGILGVAQWIIGQYAGPEEVPQTVQSYGMLLLQQSVTYPAGFLVAHVAYWPGLVLLLGLASPFLAKVVYRMGPGAVLLTGLTLIMFLGSETRQLMQVAPWLLFIGLQTVDRYWRFNPILLGILILGCWILVPWYEVWGQPGSLDGNFMAEPAQRYFRFQGPWMNDTSWRNGLFVLVGTVVLFALAWRTAFLNKAGAAAPES